MLANKLDITQWTLTSIANPSKFVSGSFNTQNYDIITHKWTIPAKLEKNEPSVLKIVYTGILDDDMKGFYRSSYMEKGVKKWMGTTQFQQTEARRAFPCMDEPGFKTTFELIMNRPKNIKSTISNTKLKDPSVQHPTM